MLSFPSLFTLPLYHFVLDTRIHLFFLNALIVFPLLCSSLLFVFHPFTLFSTFQARVSDFLVLFAFHSSLCLCFVFPFLFLPHSLTQAGSHLLTRSFAFSHEFSAICDSLKLVTFFLLFFFVFYFKYAMRRFSVEASN